MPSEANAQSPATTKTKDGLINSPNALAVAAAATS